MEGINEVLVLASQKYGKKGEYIGLNVKARCTQPGELASQHLEDKVQTVDQTKRQAFIDARYYEGLEMYVMEHLLGA